MASISTPEVDIAIGNGSTWGTARDLTGSNVGKLLHANSLTVSANFDDYRPRGVGFDNFYEAIVRLGCSVDVSVTFDIDYYSPGWLFVASILGTAAISAEITGGQGDYTHTLDLASNNDGDYTTLCYEIEDDYAVEIPSVKWHTFTISQGVNDVGTVTCQGIGDRVVLNASVSNTIAEINALSYPTFSPAPLGDTNHYFRINDDSGGGLSGSNDIAIQMYEVMISRPMQRRYTLSGANTKYTREPKQLSPTTGTLKFQLHEINDGSYDAIGIWSAQTAKKAEIFFDGAAIGSGTARSIKMQFPKMNPIGAIPTGLDVANNASLMQPVLTYELLKASSAPTGMSGVTNYMRFLNVSNRAVTLLN